MSFTAASASSSAKNKFAPIVREATVCHACDTKQRAPAVPAFLRGRDDYDWQEVLFRRPATDSPLGLGLERMGLGDAAAESIVVDEMVRGGVVDRSGAMQLGSLVHSVHGRVVVDGWSGCSEPGSFGALLEGIRSGPDVRLSVLRPNSLDCLLACAVALRRQELAHLVGASRTRSLRLALLRLLAAGGGDGSATDPHTWERRTVRLSRDARGSGLGLRLVTLGNGLQMVDGVLPGAPAARSGAVPVGAVLAQVDGVDVAAEAGVEAVQRALGGAPGSDVELVLLQPPTLAALLAAFLRHTPQWEGEGADSFLGDGGGRSRATTEDYDTWSEHEEEEDAALSSAEDGGSEEEDDEPIAPRSWQKAAAKHRRSRSPRAPAAAAQLDDDAPFEIVIEY
jgi:hypothetical protein